MKLVYFQCYCLADWQQIEEKKWMNVSI